MPSKRSSMNRNSGSVTPYDFEAATRAASTIAKLIANMPAGSVTAMPAMFVPGLVAAASHRHHLRPLRDLGKALGLDVWIASIDRSRSYADGQLPDGCLTQLPADVHVGLDSVRLIDVVWVDRSAQAVAAAFEVEPSMSIYSGIVRILDLALGTEEGENSTLFWWHQMNDGRTWPSSFDGPRSQGCRTWASAICRMANCALIGRR